MDLRFLSITLLLLVISVDCQRRQNPLSPSADPDTGFTCPSQEMVKFVHHNCQQRQNPLPPSPPSADPDKGFTCPSNEMVKFVKEKCAYVDYQPGSAQSSSYAFTECRPPAGYACCRGYRYDRRSRRCRYLG